MPHRTKLLVSLLFLVMLSACGRSAEESGFENAPAPSEVQVTVRNDAFHDANIYLLQGASRRRLGTVSGHSSRTFVLSRQTFAGLGEVRFVVDWIGRRDGEASESIVAQPGDHIELIIR